MSYTKQNWEDRDLGVGVNGTPVNAEHLNHMEDGIAANAEDIAAVNADLTDLDGLYFSSFDAIIEYVNGISTREMRLFCGANAVTSALVGVSSTCKGFFVKNTAGGETDFLFMTGGGNGLYGCRVSGGVVTYAYRLATGTSIDVSTLGVASPEALALDAEENAEN